MLFFINLCSTLLSKLLLNLTYSRHKKLCLTITVLSLLIECSRLVPCCLEGLFEINLKNFQSIVTVINSRHTKSFKALNAVVSKHFIHSRSAFKLVLQILTSLIQVFAFINYLTKFILKSCHFLVWDNHLIIILLLYFFVNCNS